MTDFKLYLNGNKIDKEIIVIDGSSYLPVRAISEALGMDVEWAAKESTINLTSKTTVLIQDFRFQPAEVTIPKGSTIVWVNMDTVRHTATGEAFDSGLLSQEQSFKQTFNETGTYDYICTPHPYMKGKVIVK